MMTRVPNIELGVVGGRGLEVEPAKLLKGRGIDPSAIQFVEF